MEKVTWRNLILAAFAGLATYVACVSWWPYPQVSATIRGPWQHNGDCHSLELSPDASLFSVRVKFYDEKGSNDTLVIRVSDRKVLARDWRYCAFSPKNDLFALYCAQSLETFDASIGKSLHKFEQKTGDHIIAAWLSADGGVFAATRRGGRVVLRQLDAKEEGKDIEVPFPDWWFVGQKWIAAPKDKFFQLWDMNTQQSVEITLPFPPTSAYPGLAISENGRRGLFSQNEDVEVFDFTSEKSDKPIFQYRLLKGMTASQLSPNGSLFASYLRFYSDEPEWIMKLRAVFGLARVGRGGGGWGVGIHDVKTGKLMGEFEYASWPVFSADGKTFGLVNGDGNVEIYDLPLKSKVPYWLFTSIAVAILFFVVLRWAGRPEEVVPQADDRSELRSK